jgi:hypothetical protein
MQFLRQAVAANGAITASLHPSCRSEDVIAVDRSGTRLAVYVY